MTGLSGEVGRRRVWIAICAIVLAGLLSGCYFPLTPSPSTPLTPTVDAGLLPTSTVPLPPPATATPSPSPTPLVPTPDPAEVAATIVAGQQGVAARGVAPICLQWVDTDGDGELEWVGLYLRHTDPPQLLGFVLDGDAWHDLRPPEGEDEERGLGEYPTCELEVRDLNADERIEIAVQGHVGTTTSLLHLFAWDGSHYALLGVFEGEGGVQMENADGDLSEEVIVRLRPEGDLVREIVYTWDGMHYAWTWDRYAWFYLDRPHAYADDTPLHALASFYLALGDRDLPGAYNLLSTNAQASRPYADWAWGFNTTLRVEVGAARVVTQAGGSATVAAHVQALDNVDGRVVLTHYDVEWQMVDTEAGWRLESGTTQVLDEWEMPYYP